MLNNKKLFFKNKKGNIGETITWFAASAIIFIILTLFILLSVLISKQKAIQPDNKFYSLTPEKDMVFEKADLSYSLYPVSYTDKIKIDNILKENE